MSCRGLKILTMVPVIHAEAAGVTGELLEWFKKVFTWQKTFV